MKLDLIALSKSSAVFLLYIALLLMLSSSVALESGTLYLPLLIWYGVALIIGYGIALGAFQIFSISDRRRWIDDRWIIFFDKAALFLLIASVLFITSHLYYLNEIPVISGAFNNDYHEVMKIRQRIFMDAPAFYRYLPNLLLKSLLPFLIIFFFVTGKKYRFIIATIVSVLYGAALMNKMFILVPIVPIFLYLLYILKFFLAAAVMLFPIIVLWILVFVQNPQIRPEFWTAPGEATMSGKAMPVEVNAAEVKARAKLAAKQAAKVALKKNKTSLTHETRLGKGNVLEELFDYFEVAWLTNTFPAKKVIETIYIRIFLVPGQVISTWFTDIPRVIPFGNGCGYRLFATIKGCDFLFFPRLVHDLENPELVKAGIKGTMTAASFMEDYANYGEKGMIGSGLVLGFLLALIAFVFRTNWLWALLLNFIPVAMLIELPLSTVLLTGGWGLSVILFLFFRERLHATGTIN